eukprot:scaffold75164_cov33-Tisochrysis_lutea.AAC.1
MGRNGGNAGTGPRALSSADTLTVSTGGNTHAEKPPNYCSERARQRAEAPNSTGAVRARNMRSRRARDGSRRASVYYSVGKKKEPHNPSEAWHTLG